MKTIFLQAIAFLFVFAPLLEAEAKIPGGYKAGTTFTLKVTEKSSIKISQFSTDTNAPIPSGIPDFARKQYVKFTIGSKGQLKASGMSLPIFLADNYSNIYGIGKDGDSKFYSAQLAKNGTKKPSVIVLSFSITSGSGFATKYQTVSYTLE